MLNHSQRALSIFIALAIGGAFSQSEIVPLPFNFKTSICNEKKTLSSYVASIDTASGEVTLNGYDGRGPAYFTFAWGDGTANETGGFEKKHTYRIRTKNYLASVMADYGSGKKDTVKVLIRFCTPSIEPKAMKAPFAIDVAIPSQTEPLILSSREPNYGAPDDHRYADTGFKAVSREVVEYVLTVAAKIQLEIADYNVEEVNGGFKQYILYDPLMEGGMVSKWYSSPVTFIAGSRAFDGTIDWSSFYHEMGHNVTLNFPKAYRFGGKIDGNANALYSETMAQIFQHTTAFEIVNRYAEFGLSPDIALEIEQTSLATLRVVRNAYLDYLTKGRKFHSWNQEITDNDEAFESFMTLAMVYCEEAEDRNDYQGPLKRMMKFLGNFDADLHTEYNPTINSAGADTFRATYMVAAFSYGMDEDLRPRFKDLKFPIKDEIYRRLIGASSNRSLNAPSVAPSLVRVEKGRVIVQSINDNSILLHRLSGRKCKVKIDATYSRGRNDKVVDTKNIPSGIYILSINGKGGNVYKILLP